MVCLFQYEDYLMDRVETSMKQKIRFEWAMASLEAVLWQRRICPEIRKMHPALEY